MSMEVNGVSHGTIKWYNVEKGYGFLIVPGCSTDVFLHVKQLRNSGILGFPTEGEAFSCEVKTGPKGLFAVNLSKNGAVASSG